MKEFRFIITDKNGLHARPAGAIASICKSFESEIRVYFEGREADGKRLLSLMSLGATFDKELVFEIEGSDEDIAVKEIERVCKEKLG